MPCPLTWLRHAGYDTQVPRRESRRGVRVSGRSRLIQPIHPRIRGGAEGIGHTVRPSGTKRRARGFTLIEIIIALAVLSVATSIFISLMGRGVALGAHSRNRVAAANIASDILAEIQARPSSFVWPPFEELQAGGAAEITPHGADPGTTGHAVVPPAGVAENDRQAEFFRKFQWLAYARLPHEGANHLEVIASVVWVEGGRPMSLKLNTTFPISLLEGAP